MSVTPGQKCRSTPERYWPAGPYQSGDDVTETPLTTPITLNAGTTYRIGTYTAGVPYFGRSDMSSTSPLGVINAGTRLPATRFDHLELVEMDSSTCEPTSAPASPFRRATTANFGEWYLVSNLSVLHLGRRVAGRQ